MLTPLKGLRKGPAVGPGESMGGVSSRKAHNIGRRLRGNRIGVGRRKTLQHVAAVSPEGAGKRPKALEIAENLERVAEKGRRRKAPQSASKCCKKAPEKRRKLYAISVTP